MRIWQPATVACFATAVGLASANAAVVTFDYNFYASGFRANPADAPPAPFDPVFGNFSITFDNTTSQIYNSVTNSGPSAGIPSDFTISSNLPGILSTATFDNFYPPQADYIFEFYSSSSPNTNLIFIVFDLLDPSQNSIGYSDFGLPISYGYSTTNITFTPVANSVPEPASLVLLAGGLLGMAVVYSRKIKAKLTSS